MAYESNVGPTGYKTCPRCKTDYSFPVAQLDDAKCPKCGAPVVMPKPPEGGNIVAVNFDPPKQ